MNIQPFKPSSYQNFAMAAMLVVCTAGVATAASGTKRIFDGTPHHCQADVPSGWLSNGIGGWDAPDGSIRISVSTGLFDSMEKNRNYILLDAGDPGVKVIENSAKRVIVSTTNPHADPKHTTWEVLVGAGSVSCEAIIWFKPATSVAGIKQVAMSVKPAH